ncbi:hypothetical protein HY251_18810 [bacterium]|nr:hypothetical protein [bacterium]
MNRGSAAALALLVAVALLVLVGCPDKPAPPTPITPSSTTQAPATTAPGTASPPTTPVASGPPGSLSGRILAPKATPAALVSTEGKDVEVCGKEHDPRSVLLAKDGALENAVVYLKGVKAPANWPDKSKTYDVTNKGCHFEPRISIVPAGVPIGFVSSDPVLHNIKTVSTQNDPFNQSVSGSNRLEHTFEKAEIMSLGCSVHPFMGGVLVVTDHPWYALTDSTGVYKLDAIPPGTYKLFVWHEKLGKAVPAGTPVTIAPGAAATLDVKFE